MESIRRDFPGGPVAKTPWSQWRRPRFSDPWLGNRRSCVPQPNKLFKSIQNVSWNGVLIPRSHPHKSHLLLLCKKRINSLTSFLSPERLWVSGARGKETSANAGGTGSILGLGRSSGRGHLVFLPRDSHGQRSLVGYSPWDHKDSDMTEAT